MQPHYIQFSSPTAGMLTPESILQARQQERTRIGQELHDNVNQILASAHLYLSILDKNYADFERMKNKAMHILMTGIEEIRKLSRDMTQQGLNNGKLIDSIHTLADNIKDTHKFNILFLYEDAAIIEALPSCQKTTLFRIIQEQVNNIVRHSKA